MLPQNSQRIRWKSSKKDQSDMTSLSGLFWYADLLDHHELLEPLKKPGDVKYIWTDSSCVKALTLMQLAGCNNIEEASSLEVDGGWQTLCRKSSGRKRMKKGLAGPSKSTLHRCLNRISEAALLQCNQRLLRAAQKHHPQTIATLDQDATIIPSEQSCAKWTYKKIKGFQPSTVVWHEQKLVVDSEFRLGNQPARKGLVEQLTSAVESLPSGIETLRYRGDSASYQKDLLAYCQKKQIKFSVSGMICQNIRDEAKTLPNDQWTALHDREGFMRDESWVEISPPTVWGKAFRFILVRKPLSSQTEMELDGLSPKQIIVGHQRFRLSLVVSNRSLPAESLIHWHRERCGYGEAIHSGLKHDCAGYWTPSKHLEANATWWTLSVLAHNLHEFLKKYLPEQYARKRLKSMRLSFIHAAGRIVHHARYVTIAVNQLHYTLFEGISNQLSQAPPMLP